MKGERVVTKIQALIPDELDERLRNYLFRRYGVHFHGKISETIRKALEEYLDRMEIDEETG